MECLGSEPSGAHACLVGKTGPAPRIVRLTGFNCVSPTMPNYRKPEDMPGTLRGGAGMECLGGSKSAATAPRARFSSAELSDFSVRLRPAREQDRWRWERN
jgi:hypothetical protein